MCAPSCCGTCLRITCSNQFSSTMWVLSIKLTLSARKKFSPCLYILVQEKSRAKFWEVPASGKLGIPDLWGRSLKETPNGLFNAGSGVPATPPRWGYHEAGGAQSGRLLSIIWWVLPSGPHSGLLQHRACVCVFPFWFFLSGFCVSSHMCICVLVSLLRS